MELISTGRFHVESELTLESFTRNNKTMGGLDLGLGAEARCNFLNFACSISLAFRMKCGYYKEDTVMDPFYEIRRERKYVISLKRLLELKFSKRF